MTMLTLERNSQDLMCGKLSPRNYFDRIVKTKTKNKKIENTIKSSNKLLKKLIK